jgi:dihydrofolate synthase / folylpolyglutamate synthase
MLTYPEALQFLASFVDYSTRRTFAYTAETLSLERVARLLDLCGRPHARFPSVHVAGTKGKGSVSALCASALQAAGYRVGLFTSPVLHDWREQIRLDGEPIALEAVASGVEALQPLVAQVPGLTQFEIVVVLALSFFARENVDVAVIEVGLGGRLDATNVIRPWVSVITSLSYDHVHLLGGALSQIAAEKAGIIKPGVPMVSALQVPEALSVLEDCARGQGAPLVVAGRDWLFRPGAHSLEGQTFQIWSAEEQRQWDALRASGRAAGWRPQQLELALLGRHQVENAAVAYAALSVLRRQGLPLSAAAVQEGFRTARWPGRFEVLSRRPCVVVDGAHNRDSARRLAEALADYFPGRPVTLVFGSSGDKDVAGMFAELLPCVSRLFLSRSSHPRAMETAELASLASAYPLRPEMAPSVRDALRQAVAQAAPDDVVLVCGSLFAVAEARASWLGLAG